MEFPRNLDEWTFETVVAIARKHAFEPGSFDFKEVLNHTNPAYRDTYNASIRRTACSMANADGGFILFGVRDRSLPANSPDDRIVGIPLGGDLRKHFSDKLSSLHRPIYFDASGKPILLPTDSNKGIFVVYVPQSLLRPHMDESIGSFYRRGEGGNADIMKFYQVREQMMHTEERLRKVILFRLKIAQYRSQINLFHEQGDNVTSTLLRFDTSAFEIILVDVCGFISADLMQNLLNIPVLANLVNEFLERSTYPGLRVVQDGQPDPQIERRKAILGNLTALNEICLQCEQRLEEIFGPLGEI